MKLIEEEQYFDELDLVDANDLNHNLYGPLTEVYCEVWLLKSREYILSGGGYGADQNGGEHEMEFEIQVTYEQLSPLVKNLKIS